MVAVIEPAFFRSGCYVIYSFLCKFYLGYRVFLLKQEALRMSG